MAQVEHLQYVERRLPLRNRSEIYTHAIRTEGEAARYIRQVTEAIHKAHSDAAAERAKRTGGVTARRKANAMGKKSGKRK